MTFTVKEIIEAGAKSLRESPWRFMGRLVYPMGVTPWDFDYEEFECRPPDTMETKVFPVEQKLEANHGIKESKGNGI